MRDFIIVNRTKSFSILTLFIFVIVLLAGGCGDNGNKDDERINRIKDEFKRVCDKQVECYPGDAKTKEEFRAQCISKMNTEGEVFFQQLKVEGKESCKTDAVAAAVEWLQCVTNQFTCGLTRLPASCSAKLNVAMEARKCLL